MTIYQVEKRHAELIFKWDYHVFSEPDLSLSWNKTHRSCDFVFPGQQGLGDNQSFGDNSDDFCLLDCTHLSYCQMTLLLQLNSRNLSNAFYVPGTVLGAKDTKLSKSVSVFKEFIA